MLIHGLEARRNSTHFNEPNDDGDAAVAAAAFSSLGQKRLRSVQVGAMIMRNRQNPRAFKMGETVYGDSATPSLQQEMNLARRACWCKTGDLAESPPQSHVNQCCEKCCHTKATASITTPTITTRMPSSAGGSDGDGEDGDDEQDTDDDDDDRAVLEDNSTMDVTTSVLNGATFSKIITNILNIDNERNCKAIITDDIDGADYSCRRRATITCNAITTNSPTSLGETNLDIINLNKAAPAAPDAAENSAPAVADAAATTTPIVNEKCAESGEARTKPGGTFRSHAVLAATLGYARELLLPFWLAFVAFCDAMTIKSDDPRFAEARRRQREKEELEKRKRQEQQEKQQQEQKERQRQENDKETSNKTKAAKPGKRYKLITNKKIIFLFLVCVFFTCVNRIEARPNTSTSSNAVAGESVIAAATGDSGFQAEAKLASTSDSKDGSTAAPPQAPPASNALPQNPPLDIQYLSGEKDEEEGHSGHHMERYPLSQVDFGHVKTPFIIGVWILSASIAKIGFHMTPKLHLIFPESCLLITVGVVIGVILLFGTEVGVSPLTPNTFFFYMLPPIILDAGYFMPNRLFFDNLGTILLMAVVGTIFNTATIGGSLYACGLAGVFGDVASTPRFLDTFLFAALISAVDPVAVLAVFEEIHVNEILYIVVFGESLLNDAVTVVMYHMMEAYNEIGISNIIAQDVISGVGSFFVVAIGGTVIGIIWGFLTGLVTRFTDHVRVIEPIFIFVMAYLAYLNAEIFHMSGILAITFCGITMKNYVESNISQKSHTTVKYALKMLSSSSETIIFMFLGVATVNNSHVWNTWFVVLTITFCSVFRVIGVIILTAIANRFRLHKLSRVDQFVMSYGGLRGAVAFALVLLVDENVVKQKDMFVTTTIAVIYFTVFVQGITIKPLVKFLNVKRANKRKPTMNERIHERFMDHLMAGIEDIVGKTGNYNVRDKFKRFDNRFIRPLLIRDLKQGAEPKIIETYSKLTMRDAMEVMRRNPSTIGQITGTESMSALFRNYTNNCIGGRWAPPTIYTTCPSLTNLDNSCSRNLDMHELDYNPSKKDLTDARIHHLLAEELKPYRRHRRLSYSRHAVDDRDLSTQVNYKMQMNFRRMFNDRKHHKRSKRGTSKQQEGVKQNHVSFHDFQQNGTTKQFSHDYINEVLNESAEENPPKLTEVTVVGPSDDWDDGLTFTAKSSPDSDRANNNSLIAHIQNLPGFDSSKARIVQHYAEPKSDSSSPEKLLTPDVGPTAAELILPWRRDRSYQSIVAENPIPEEDRNISRDSDGERRVATPTATESQLPWKRQGDEISDAVQQNEFPAWASNKEYLAYNSPSATFLGGINKPKQPKSVIGLFRRESSGSKGGSSLGGGDVTDAGSARGSDPTLAAALMGVVMPSAHNPRLDKRSQSISTGSGVGVGEGHSGPFPVTASHRRNVRRGSMLELSGDIIPEETYQHGHSKSLCEPAGDEWDTHALETGSNDRTRSDRMLRGGREPLLPKLTPRGQIRRVGAGGSKSQVTSALLSTSNSDYDDDEDEDFDLYDDENIVVTTTTNPAVANGAGAGVASTGGVGTVGIRGRSGSGGAATTTTIRMTRNNDESII